MFGQKGKPYKFNFKEENEGIMDELPEPEEKSDAVTSLIDSLSEILEPEDLKTVLTKIGRHLLDTADSIELEDEEEEDEEETSDSDEEVYEGAEIDEEPELDSETDEEVGKSEVEESKKRIKVKKILKENVLVKALGTDDHINLKALISQLADMTDSTSASIKSTVNEFMDKMPNVDKSIKNLLTSFANIGDPAKRKEFLNKFANKQPKKAGWAD